MSTPTHRSLLRETLAATAGPAIEMVRNERPRDPILLLSALEAAGLLHDQTVGEAHAGLRTQLVEAVRHQPDAITWLVRDVLDLSEPRLPTTEAALQQSVEQWITLSALASVAHAGAQQRLTAFLQEAEALMAEGEP